jgi:energy-coupling factor transporter transmembrane protein EcfT
MSSVTLSSLSPLFLFGTACAFVAGTAWNEAVQAFIAKYYPEKSGDTLKAKLVYAFVVTLIIMAAFFAVSWLVSTTREAV